MLPLVLGLLHFAVCRCSVVVGPWSLVRGRWPAVDRWSLVRGLRQFALGILHLVIVPRSFALGLWSLVRGPWSLALGLRPFVVGPLSLVGGRVSRRHWPLV